MRLNLGLLTMTLMFSLLAGCHKIEWKKMDSQEDLFPRNVQGNWVLRDVNPPENAQQFTMQAVTFNADQTYVARILKESNRLETVRGTYRYDGWSHRLYLHTGPDQRSYGAMIWFGTELHLEGDSSAGQNGNAIMMRSNLKVIPDAVQLERRTR